MMDDLLWPFEKRLEILWRLETCGESMVSVAARHGLDMAVLIRWKAFYGAVSVIKPDPAELSKLKTALENQTVLLEKLASELNLHQVKKYLQ